MKRKLLFLMTACALLFGGTNAWAGTKTVYLNPGGWNFDGARYALHLFDNTAGTNTWVCFVPVGNGSSLYKAEFDDNWPNMIICRMSGSASGNNWDNRWAETATLETPFFDGITYTVTGYSNGNTTLTDNKNNFPAYVYNVGAQAFLTKGGEYSTHAVTTNNGAQVDIYYKSAGHYSIHTGFGNGYFNSNGYVDSAEKTWNFVSVAGLPNAYKIYAEDEGKYAYSTQGLYNVMVGDDTGDDKSYWKIETAAKSDDYRVTSNSPILNKSLKITNARFDKEKSGSTYSGQDGGSNNGWNGTSSGIGGQRVVIGGWGDYGNEERWNTHNPVAEFWNKTYDIYQDISFLPIGMYRVKCQGFYRAGDQGTTATDQNAILYATGETTAETPLMNINSGASSSEESGYTKEVGSTGTYVPNGLTDASTIFSAGAYSDNAVDVYVTGGTLRIGLKKTAEVANDWTCFDNFQLFYLGRRIQDAAALLPNTGYANAETWYSVIIPAAGDYPITSTLAATINYTQDGTALETITGTTLSFTANEQKTLSLNAGVLYIKSSQPQVVTINNVTAGGENQYYLSTIVDGETKWLADFGEDGKAGVKDNGSVFYLEKTGDDTYQLKFSDGNYLNDVGSNWVVKVTGSHNNEWVLQAVDGGYKFKLNVDKTCELFVKDTSTGLVEITHSTADGNVWQFVTRDYYENIANLNDINSKITAVGELPYAASAKKPAIYEGSSDIASHVTSLTTALRAYVESNALGEGVNATNYTSYISDASCPADYTTTNPDPNGRADFVEISGTGWNVSRVRANTGSGWTDSEGTLHQPYFDTNGTMWNGYTGVTTASMSQTISNLPSGKYLLTVKARSSGTFSSFIISGNGTEETVTNANGVFGNNWDDTSVLFTVGANGQAVILLQAIKGNDSDRERWFSADNFRLVRVGDLDAVTISETATTAPASAVANVTLTRSLTADKWNTFCVPFDLSSEEIAASALKGATIKQFRSSGNDVIYFESTNAIEAGKPYLVRPTSDVVNPTFEGVTVQNTEGVIVGEGNYKFAGQVYNKSLPTDGTIAYLSTDGTTIKKLTSGGIKGLRAYFIIPSGSSGARIAFDDDNTTGISEEFVVNGQNQYYDLQGRKIVNPTKGFYVINGKKVVIK